LSQPPPRSGGDLRSSGGPPPPGPEDHVRGEGASLVIVYGDYECPYCARTELLLAGLPVELVFRHFPVPSKHPRARALAQAAEAAALQGRFWEMHDSLFGDQGHLDDPHLWQRAERLGLDVDRFERDRRSPEVDERVTRDFRSGVRAGVMTTPTLFVDGELVSGAPPPELIERLRSG
jgi:protein-disulfide isomerase